jgi:hypothetical protein
VMRGTEGMRYPKNMRKKSNPWVHECASSSSCFIKDRLKDVITERGKRALW